MRRHILLRHQNENRDLKLTPVMTVIRRFVKALMNLNVDPLIWFANFNHSVLSWPASGSAPSKYRPLSSWTRLIVRLIFTWNWSVISYGKRLPPKNKLVSRYSTGKSYDSCDGNQHYKYINEPIHYVFIYE